MCKSPSPQPSRRGRGLSEHPHPLGEGLAERGVRAIHALRQELQYSLQSASFLALMLLVPSFLTAQTSLPTAPKATVPPLPTTQANITLARTSLLKNSTTANSSTSSLRALLAEKNALASLATLQVPLYTPLLAHGRLFLNATHAFITIGKQDIPWLDYNGFAEILAAKTPMFPLFLGSQGAFNHGSFFGSSVRDIAVMVNGRPTNDIALGAAHLEHLPPEMMEQAEIYIGSDAVILANNASGAAINLQEIRHNVKDFYTRAWISQSNEQYTAADVDFSHNVAPNLNFTLGARTQFGSRIYNNTGISSWNARAKLHWNVSSSANVSLSYLLTQHRSALSGGVTTATFFDFNTSATIFNELRENTFRHDLTLTASAYLSRDSAIAASLTGYASLNQRSLERALRQGTGLNGQRGGGGFGVLPDTLIAESTTNTFTVGVTGRVETRVRLFNALDAALTAGGSINASNVQTSVYWDESMRRVAWQQSTRGTVNPPARDTVSGEISGFGRLQFTLLDRVNTSGGARFTLLNGRPYLAVGARFSTLLLDEHKTSTNGTFSTTLELWGDFSQSSRAPTLSEQGMNVAATARFSTAATTQLPELRAEDHTLILGGLRLRQQAAKSAFSCDFTAALRTIQNEIRATPVFQAFPHVVTTANLEATNRLRTMQTSNNTSSYALLSASLMADWYVQNVLFGGNFVFSGYANCTVPISRISQNLTQLVPERFPLVSAGCTAQYEYVVGRSVLRAGIRVRMMTTVQTQGFMPTTWTYFDNDFTTNPTQGLTGNGIDIVAAARVGNAYLRATYQNALSVPATTVGFYPQYPTNIRLSGSFTILE